MLLWVAFSSLTTGINEAWYLDHGVSNPRFMQSDWTLYYSHDPFAGLSPTQLQFNLGGAGRRHGATLVHQALIAL